MHIDENRSVDISFDLNTFARSLGIELDANSDKESKIDFYRRYALSSVLDKSKYPSEITVFNKEVKAVYENLFSVVFQEDTSKRFSRNLAYHLSSLSEIFTVSYMDAEGNKIETKAGIASVKLNSDSELTFTIFNPEHFFNALSFEKGEHCLYHVGEQATAAEFANHMNLLVEYINKKDFDPQVIYSKVSWSDNLGDLFNKQLIAALKHIDMEEFLERMKEQDPDRLKGKKNSLAYLIKYFSFSKNDLGREFKTNTKLQKDYESSQSSPSNNNDSNDFMSAVVLIQLMDYATDNDSSSSNSDSSSSSDYSSDSSSYDGSSSSDSGSSDGGGSSD